MKGCRGLRDCRAVPPPDPSRLQRLHLATRHAFTPKERERNPTAVGPLGKQGDGAWRAETRDGLEGKGPQRRRQQRLDRRLEEVAKAVGGGYCRLQMPLRPSLGVRGTGAGRRLGALEGGGGGSPPFQCITGRGCNGGS